MIIIEIIIKWKWNNIENNMKIIMKMIIIIK